MVYKEAREKFGMPEEENPLESIIGWDEPKFGTIANT
jgi:hypothetical protein